MYPNIEYDAYSPARYSANIHVGGSAYAIGNFIEAAGAQTKANAMIRDFQEQGMVVTQAYVFDFLTGQLVLDLMPKHYQTPLLRRIRLFIKLIAGV